MIQVVYSTQHWIVPRIIMVLLAVLLVAIIVTEAKTKKSKGKTERKSFFIPNADFVKLFGSIILFIAYIYLLEVIGFTVTSLVFVFLFNLLYGGVSKKSIITSVIISVVATLLISLLFGVAFNITLPKGICTMYLTGIGVTIY